MYKTYKFKKILEDKYYTVYARDISEAVKYLFALNPDVRMGDCQLFTITK